MYKYVYLLHIFGKLFNSSNEINNGSHRNLVGNLIDKLSVKITREERVILK
jgi:hypothetical protein